MHVVPKKRDDDSKKVQRSIGLPQEVWDLIDELARSEPPLYGDSGGEVTRNLILDQLKIIARDRLLKPR